MPKRTEIRDPRQQPDDAPAEASPDLVVGTKGAVPAPDEDDTGAGQLGSASGGYGNWSGLSSGGTGDGEPGAGTGAEAQPTASGSEMDDGTSSGATGATRRGPTEWVREAEGRTPKA